MRTSVPGVNWSALAANMREVKDEEELRLTRKAIRLAERALREMKREGRNHWIGRTEKSLAAELEFRMRNLGADRQAFTFNGIILASGPNTAACHHQPTNRKVRANEAILVDWGAEADGYRSDMTRMVYTGTTPPSPFPQFHAVIDEARQLGIDAIRPRRTSPSIDQTVRAFITAAGHGPKFRHGLGHSIGLEVHEPPFMGRPMGEGGMLLRKDMLLTVEPGIYTEGQGGVRLEDMIRVDATGCERLSKMPTSWASSLLPA